MDPIFVDKSNKVWTFFRQQLNEHFRTLRIDLDEMHRKSFTSKCAEYTDIIQNYEQENQQLSTRCNDVEVKLAAAEEKLTETMTENKSLNQKYAKIKQRYGELQTECKLLLNRNNRITSLLASDETNSKHHQRNTHSESFLQSFNADMQRQSMVSFDMPSNRNALYVKR